MASLSEIEALTAEYAGARNRLAELVTALNDEIDAAKKRYLARIRREAELVAELKANLRSMVEAAPQLFAKPRTQVFHGIKVGFIKGKGELTWSDSNRVVSLIKKNFPATWKNYVKVKEFPLKSALADLGADELKKLGVSISGADDEVVIKPMDSEVEKLVDALLAEDKQ